MTSGWLTGHRDKVIAGCLAGAVVVVVGYASGIGLRTEAAAAPTTPPAAGQPGAQAAAPAQPGLPVGDPPPAGAVPQVPSGPGAEPPPTLPGTPPPTLPAPPPNQPNPGHGDHPTTPPGSPPTTTPPPGAEPECQESVLRTLTDLLLPSTALLAPAPTTQAEDDNLLDGTLDLLAGDCEDTEAPEEDPTETSTPHDGDTGHGGG